MFFGEPWRFALRTDFNLAPFSRLAFSVMMRMSEAWSQAWAPLPNDMRLARQLLDSAYPLPATAHMGVLLAW
jgi:hypothetical protein